MLEMFKKEKKSFLECKKVNPHQNSLSFCCVVLVRSDFLLNQDVFKLT